MMEKEESTCRLRTWNAERRKGRRDVVDGDEILITTDDVINACTNFTNVVIRIMRARVVATHLRSKI